MRKITLTLLVALSVASLSSFTGDTKPKQDAKCTKGGSCCKNQSKAALLKAKSKTAVAVKKA